MKESERIIQELEDKNRELSENESSLNKKVQGIWEELKFTRRIDYNVEWRDKPNKDGKSRKNEPNIWLDWKICKISERIIYSYLKDNLEREYNQLKNDFDVIFDQNNNLQANIKDLEEYIESVHKRVEEADKEMQELLQRGDAQELKELLDEKEHLLKEVNSQLDKALHKIKNGEKDMKELMNRNIRQEEAILRYQEVWTKSSWFSHDYRRLNYHRILSRIWSESFVVWFLKIKGISNLKLISINLSNLVLKRWSINRELE